MGYIYCPWPDNMCTRANKEAETVSTIACKLYENDNGQAQSIISHEGNLKELIK